MQTRSQMPPEWVIDQNSGHHNPLPKDTFMCALHEREIWDEDRYWELDKALAEVAIKYRDTTMPRELTLKIFDIYQYVFGRLCYHEMPRDGSSIENLTDEQCGDWRERVEYVVRSALGGHEVHNTGTCELENPLL